MSHYDKFYQNEVDLGDYCIICGEKKQEFCNQVCSDCAAEYELKDKQEHNPLRGE